MADKVLERIARQPSIRRMLGEFLDRLDDKPFGTRSQRLFVRPGVNALLELNAPMEPDGDQILWSWVKRLAQAGILDIDRERRPLATDLPWQHALVVMRPEGEATVRAWLDRPPPTPTGAAWREAVDRLVPDQVDGSLLRASPLNIPGMSPESVVGRLLEAPAICARGAITTRQLSAWLFNGDSKRLEGREGWLKGVFGSALDTLVERHLLVEVALADSSPGCLLIENQDSYLEAVEGRWPEAVGLNLVYTAGFRASAERLRRRDLCRLHFSASGQISSDAANVFEKRWFDCDEGPSPIYFFGDFDWAGLRIFTTLRRLFPWLLPWRPGYEGLIRALSEGRAHAPEAAAKADQVPIEATGDEWMDREVVERLRGCGLFVDQEILALMGRLGT